MWNLASSLFRLQGTERAERTWLVFDLGISHIVDSEFNILSEDKRERVEWGYVKFAVNSPIIRPLASFKPDRET